MDPSKKVEIVRAPVCMTKAQWLSMKRSHRWPWVDDELPYEFFCGSIGTGSELCEVELFRRLLVQPRRKGETTEAFLGRVNKTLKHPYNLRPTRRETFGEDGLRLVAIERIVQHGAIVEMVCWFRREGRCEWMRFPVEAQVEGGSHHPMIILPIVYGPQGPYLGMVKENRATLLWEQTLEDAMSGVKDGWALGPPQGFAAFHDDPEVDLRHVPVRGLREEPPLSLQQDSRSLFARKVRSLIAAEEGKPEKPLFELLGLTWSDRFHYNPGQSNVWMEVMTASLEYVGDPDQFEAAIARRYGPRFGRLQFHPLARLLGEDRDDVCRELGIITAVQRATLFGLTNKKLENLRNI